MEGTYRLAVSTPEGQERGVVELRKTEEDRFTGTIDILGAKKNIYGKLDGENITFSGELSTYYGLVTYTVQAMITDDGFKGVAKTNYGAMSVTGTKL